MSNYLKEQARLSRLFWIAATALPIAFLAGFAVVYSWPANPPPFPQYFTVEPR